jgi:cytidyltransferase-like protein
VKTHPKKVMVFGTFDLIHPGHVHFLEQAKKLGDTLTVVIARDETVLKVKGHLPIHSAQERQSLVEKLGIASKVLIGGSGDKFQVVRDESPQIIALGYDQQSIVEDLEKKVGERVQIVRLVGLKPDQYKSSKLKARLT